MAKLETPINILPDAPQVRQRKGKIIVDERGLLDLPFLALTLILLLIGLVMMFSASYARAYETEGNSTYYFARQAFFAVGGVAAMLFLSTVPYQWWRRIAIHLYTVTLILLLAVLLFGSSAGGARRWINIGIRFQPSELAKFSVIVMFASLISIYREKMASVKYGIYHFIGILLPIFLLLALQPHLSAIIIIGAVGAIMMLIGGSKPKYFIIAAIAAVVLFVIYLQIKPYAMDRWIAWRNPFDYADDEGFQTVQSLYAIGSGGLMGLGLGRSRQKYLYLPEEHNDYIFAIVCEELGFIGAMVILVLFAMLIVRGYWIAMHAKDRFGAMLAAGITTLLALQVVLNIAVVTNFIPATGISLPFFSYGGTALLLQLGEMGIVLSVSRQCDNKLL